MSMEQQTGVNEAEDAEQPTREPAPCATICYPPVLDVCCGSRMMWFDKADSRAIYHDKRKESHEIEPNRGWPNGTTIVINPDVQGDFTALQFPDETFWHVVFDPPHLTKLGETGILAKRYGRLFGHWECDIQEGFRECFRVLKPNGTLIFKWSSVEIPLSRVIPMAPVPPWKRGEVEAAMPHPLRAEIVWAKDCHVGPPCPAAMRDERIWLFSRDGFKGNHFETTVWDEPIIPTWEHKRHKNEKPLGLMRRLIRFACKPGDVICDPFMGSGTTLRAAADLGHPCIGIDVNETYCKATVDRLRQRTLFAG